MPDAGRTHGPPATRKAGGSHHRQGRNNRHSLRNGLRLIARSPRGTGLVSPRRPLVIISELDPSVGGSGPHAFAVRLACARLAPSKRPSHPASHVRDDREPPLQRKRDVVRQSYISEKRKRNIFRGGT